MIDFLPKEEQKIVKEKYLLQSFEKYISMGTIILLKNLKVKYDQP